MTLDSWDKAQKMIMMIDDGDYNKNLPNQKHI